MGVPGYDHLWQDFGVKGIDAARETLERYRDEVAQLPDPQGPWDQLAQRILVDFLEQSLDDIRHGEPLRDINNTASPLQLIVQVFDLMDTSTAEGCRSALTRLSTLSEALGSWQEALTEGIERGLMAARRQVLSAMDECRSYAGATSFLDSLSNQLVSLL